METWDKLRKLDETVIKTKSAPIMTMSSKMTEMKIQMSDYPTFNGKYASWPAFYDNLDPLQKSKDSKTFWNTSSPVKMTIYIYAKSKKTRNTSVAYIRYSIFSTKLAQEILPFQKSRSSNMLKMGIWLGKPYVLSTRDKEI